VTKQAMLVLKQMHRLPRTAYRRCSQSEISIQNSVFSIQNIGVELYSLFHLVEKRCLYEWFSTHLPIYPYSHIPIYASRTTLHAGGDALVLTMRLEKWLFTQRQSQAGYTFSCGRRFPLLPISRYIQKYLPVSM